MGARNTAAARARRAIAALLCALAASAAAAEATHDVQPCGSRPNCVSSRNPRADTAHRVEPLGLAVPPQQGWAAARRAVEGLPRVEIVESTDAYLHALVRSRIFRFADELELRLDPAEHRIDVRSAARLGYSDFGVNRRRVEALRTALRREGVVE